MCPGLLSQWEHVFLKTSTNRQKKIKANTKRETTQVEGKPLWIIDWVFLGGGIEKPKLQPQKKTKAKTYEACS